MLVTHAPLACPVYRHLNAYKADNGCTLGTSQVRDALAQATGVHYDSVLINYYEDGRCALAWPQPYPRTCKDRVDSVEAVALPHALAVGDARVVPGPDCVQSSLLQCMHLGGGRRGGGPGWPCLGHATNTHTCMHAHTHNAHCITHVFCTAPRLELYHRCGMRYHVDPLYGVWDPKSAVVSIGATRRFAFREASDFSVSSHC